MMLRICNMQTKSSCNWSNVRIRTTMRIRILNFIKTKQAKSLGISNPSQFLDLIIREKLDVLEGNLQ